MNNPLHAKYYADKATQSTVEVVENVEMARDTFRVRFRCPELAARALPGQFVMLRLAGFDDPLIGRPLAVYDVVPSSTGEPESIDAIYLVKGKLTTRLVKFQPGQRLDVWGPLGNGFEAIPTKHLVMVAGGIGQTPFVCLAKEYLGLQRFGTPQREPACCDKVTLCYGGRSADLLAGIEDFKRLGVDVRIATDDGSLGHHGLVTEVLSQVLAESKDDCQVVCCGPEPMMEAVAHVTGTEKVPCRVSLETPMACGIGICFSCVAKVRDASGEWDYKRTCVDGPVFDAELIEW
ncbi:MAG: dihydroorotate dehydrogenase electron transfer subunit [Planctomycetaceae bacterium]|nr:dihydroorotate dehydrogenase electron transfer subunit [Planctomycetaceae bacterium]MCB9941828.1 dihydroorotate dehydrogenase electron transfer subunit [Planctomycetaceae bacterium]